MKEEAMLGNTEVIKDYTDLHTINEEEDNVKDMKNWRDGHRKFVKNVPKVKNQIFENWIEQR